MRLNRKTGNRRKRTGWAKHDKTGNKTDWREGRANGAQRNRKRNGTGEKAGRNGQRNGGDGNAERATHEEMGDKTDGTEMATGSRREGTTDGENGSVQRVARNETERR